MALVKNSVLNLFPSLLGVAVSIATVPFYISIVGTERYGGLLLALVLLGYFGQADFGLGRALTQRLSSMRDATAADRASVVWSALAGAGVISLFGGLLVYLVAAVFFTSHFDAGPALRNEVLSSVWLFALCVPVMMLTGVTSGALTGLERFGVVSVGTTVGNLLSQVLPLFVATVFSVQFGWLLAASILGRLIGLVPLVVSMAAVFLRHNPVNLSVERLRQLFSFGSWIMVTAIVGPLMTMADRVVIGAVLGAGAVVAYSVPVQIAARTVMFPMAIVQALFPRLASRDDDEAARLGKSSVVLIAQLYGLMVIGLICLTAPLLQLWLGDKLDNRSILVGQITFVGVWVNALASVPYALIQARGNSRFTALLHVLELPVYGAMLYGFGLSMGLYGVAWAFTLRVILDCGALLYKAEIADARVLSRLVGPAILISIAFAASPWMQDWFSGLVGASILCASLLVIMWFQLPCEARDWMNLRIRR